jgi:hypothetical protein
MAETKITKADLAAHIDRVSQAMRGSDLAGLLERLTELERSTRFPKRAPFALVADAEQNLRRWHCSMSLEPFCLCEPTHIVVTPETAAHWELADFQVGNVSIRAGFDGGNLPLDTFSAAYVHNDKVE